MKKILHYIKSVSGIVQKKDSSYTDHNNSYLQEGKLEQERTMAQKMLAEKEYDNSDNKISKLLARFPNRELCVDIGSGCGWYSAYLSGIFKKAVGIEPSAAAIDMAKQIFPPAKYSNVSYMMGFAEENLANIPIDQTPTLFVTGCVFSHMRDKEVAAICKIINEKAKKGSALSFSECWGEKYNKLMWHVRTKEWWQEQLSNFELDFHGAMIENIPGRYKGIHGIKIK